MLFAADGLRLGTSGDNPRGLANSRQETSDGMMIPGCLEREDKIANMEGPSKKLRVRAISPPLVCNKSVPDEAGDWLKGVKPIRHDSGGLDSLHAIEKYDQNGE